MKFDTFSTNLSPFVSRRRKTKKNVNEIIEGKVGKKILEITKNNVFFLFFQTFFVV